MTKPRTPWFQRESTFWALTAVRLLCMATAGIMLGLEFGSRVGTAAFCALLALTWSD